MGAGDVDSCARARDHHLIGEYAAGVAGTSVTLGTTSDMKEAPSARATCHSTTPLLRKMLRYLVLAAVLVGPTLDAQQRPGDVSTTAPLDSQYAAALTALQEKVVALANAIPAEKYAWRPSDEVRTVSEVLMHIAGEWYYLCPRSVGAKPPEGFQIPAEAMRRLEQITAKPEVVAELGKSWEYCRSVLSAMNRDALVPDSLPARMGFPRVVLLVVGDQHEHLGQLIAYARSVGVAPPWSR